MKKILVISLLLALLLTLIMPTTVLASSPATFSAQGYMASIDTGNVNQIGHSDRWLVRNRTIEGQLLTGDLGNAAFELHYDGIFSLTTQAGSLIGTLNTANASILVLGEAAPLTMVSVGPYSLPMLTISGSWVGLRGLKANGDFQGYLIFVPTADGHVDYIVDSGFAMTGTYNGRH
jgi:hypothetical protein